MNSPQGPQPYRQNPPPPPPHQYRPPPPSQAPPPPPPAHYGQPPFPQHYAQPPQYGRQPGPTAPRPDSNPYAQPSEGIVVNTQFFPLSWLLFFFKPKIAVDGHEMPVSGWGRTLLPARPGPHHVHVHVPYILPPRLGPADATADVRPGQLAELEYKAPLFPFSAGSLGIGPQRYNGVGITIAIIAIPFVLVLVMIVISILLTML